MRRLLCQVIGYWLVDVTPDNNLMSKQIGVSHQLGETRWSRSLASKNAAMALIGYKSLCAVSANASGGSTYAGHAPDVYFLELGA